MSENSIFEWSRDNNTLQQRTDGFLASLTYHRIDKEKALEWMHDRYYPVSTGACTSFQANGKRYRNYDWLYDNHPTFIIRTKQDDRNPARRYASIGIAQGFGELEKDFVHNKFSSELYDILPFMLLDGVNSEGLTISTNVCQIYDDDGNIDITNITGKPGGTICGMMLAREILDNCHTVSSAKNLVNSLNIFMPNTENFREELHYLISDKFGNSTVLEFKDNQPVWTNSTVITNFKLCAQTGYDYGAGYERYDIVTNGLAGDEDPEEILKSVWYTNTYKSFKESWDVQWLSECNGKGEGYDLHQGLPASAYDTVKERMVEMYDNRDRENPNTWQTVHSVIYDATNNSMKLYVQETDIPLEFEMFKESDMTDYVPLFEPNLQFKYNDSKLLVNGKLYVYDVSTDTKADIYSDDSAAVMLTQPVRTDNQGRGPIYVADGRYYRLEVYDANNKLLWTQSGLPPMFMNEGVVHDITLLGDGTNNSPLTVNTEVIATNADLADLRQDMEAGDAYLQYQIDNIHVETNVIHDDTLSGNGTSAQPLGVSPLVSLATESPITNRTENGQLIIGLDSAADITPYTAGHNITISNHQIASVDEISKITIGDTTNLYWIDVFNPLFDNTPALQAYESIYDSTEQRYRFIQGFEAKLVTSSGGSAVSQGNYALFTRIDPDSKKLIVWKCEPATHGSFNSKCRWTKTEEEIGGAGQFIAEYGVTSYEDIKAAYDAGKTIIAKRDEGEGDYRYYQLSEFLSRMEAFRFSSVDYFGFQQGIIRFSTNWYAGQDKQVLFTDTGVMNDELNYNDEHTAITGISGTPIGSTGGLVAVEHDGTLTGDGSSDSPMGISNDFTIPYSAHEDYGWRQEDRYTQLIYTPNQALVTTYSSVATQDDRPGETFTTYESNAITPGGVRSELLSTDKNGDIKTNETKLAAEIGPNDIYWSMSALDGTEETASLRQVASAMNAYSANWNSTYSTVQSNSAAWGQDTGITAVEHDKTLTGKGISSDKAGVNEIWVPVKDDDGAITLTARSDAPHTGNYVQITPNWSANENEAHVRVFSEYGDNKWHWQEMDGGGSGLFHMHWGSGSNIDGSAATAHLQILNGDIAYSTGSGTPADQTCLWSVSAMARDLNMKVPASYVSPDYDYAELGTRSLRKAGQNGSYIEMYEYDGHPQLAVNDNNRITQIMGDGMRIYDGDWNLLHEFDQYDMKLSGKSFNSVYDTVSSNSASWGQGGGGRTYNGISGVSVDNLYNTVGLNSATTAILSSVSAKSELIAGSNITLTETENGLVIAAQGGALPQSANWNSCYTTVNSNSANWNNTRTTVNSYSASWQNKQNMLTFSYENNAITAINASAIGGTIEGYSAVAGNHFSIVDDDIAKTTTMGIDFTINIEDL